MKLKTQIEQQLESVSEHVVNLVDVQGGGDNQSEWHDSIESPPLQLQDSDNPHCCDAYGSS